MSNKHHSYLSSATPPGVVITERGFRSKYYNYENCEYRRNTKIEYGDKTWIVITIGELYKHKTSGVKQIQRVSNGAYYETCAYVAAYDDLIYDIDVMNPVEFESYAKLDVFDEMSCVMADIMHDEVVAELAQKIRQ